MAEGDRLIEFDGDDDEADGLVRVTIGGSVYRALALEDTCDRCELCERWDECERCPASEMCAPPVLCLSTSGAINGRRIERSSACTEDETAWLNKRFSGWLASAIENGDKVQ